MMIVVQGMSWLTMGRIGTAMFEARAAKAVSKALDDAHDDTTIRTGRNLGRGLSVRIDVRPFAIVWRCTLMIKNGAAKGELGGAVAFGHEAEVADAVEPVRQRMKEGSGE